MTNKESNNFLCFVIGGIIGLGVGLLYAPKKGTETREKIIDILKDIKDKGEEQISKTKKIMNEIYENGKDFIVDEEK
jgi:gas vesicle protein